MFSTGGPPERESNLEPAFVTALEAATGLQRAFDGEVKIRARISPKKGLSIKRMEPDGFTPEDVFHYIYGLFHVPAYRERYAGFLRSEFPRILLPPSADAFHALAAVGRDLAGLHLLRTATGASVDYPTTGPNTVDKGFPRFVAPDEPGPDGTATDTGRVFINPAQCFDGVPEHAWTFVVGGYQVLKKWLDDRRKAGHVLTRDDRTHYRKTVEALAATPALMDAADTAAVAAFGWDDDTATS